MDNKFFDTLEKHLFYELEFKDKLNARFISLTASFSVILTVAIFFAKDMGFFYLLKANTVIAIIVLLLIAASIACCFFMIYNMVVALTCITYELPPDGKEMDRRFEEIKKYFEVNKSPDVFRDSLNEFYKIV